MTAMETCTMAELRYEAPLATFDLDEWNEFLDGGGDGDDPDDPGFDVRHPGTSGAAMMDRGGGGEEGEGGGVGLLLAGEGNFEDDETFSGSLEDLVNTFDDKIIKCFRNYGEQAETIAPVQVRSQDDLIQDSQTWWTLTGNYGGILPIDWSQLYPQDPSADKKNIEENTEITSHESECRNDEEEDDDEDDDETDMEQEDGDRTSGGQSIYTALQKGEEEEVEPVVTADEAIREIEGMLDGLPPDKNTESPKNGHVTRRRRLEHVIKKFVDKDLQSFSMRGLSGLRDELGGSVRDLSEILVEELAGRDELDYEKELKNQFIWLLLTVQKRRREVLLEMSYRQKSKVIGNGYLTTVIPYQASQDPLTIDKLQIYIKILSAVNEDHCSVPSLLTDYILRVLCPTT